MIEVGAVIYGGDIGRRSTKYLGLPCVLVSGWLSRWNSRDMYLTGVQMTVEVNYGDGTIGAVDGP